MSIRSSKNVYQLIEKHLQHSAEPLTCVELMEFPDLRQAALEEYGSDIQLATNRVSDALGFMWRRDLLSRYSNADVTSKARFAYKWSERTTSSPISSPSGKKPEMKITEKEGKVVIELKNITITIATTGA